MANQIYSAPGQIYPELQTARSFRTPDGGTHVFKNNPVDNTVIHKEADGLYWRTTDQLDILTPLNDPEVGDLLYETVSGLEYGSKATVLGLTTRGDILTGGITDTAILPIGSEGAVLTSDGVEPYYDDRHPLTVWYVDANGSGAGPGNHPQQAFSTLADAITASENGDTIWMSDSLTYVAAGYHYISGRRIFAPNAHLNCDLVVESPASLTCAELTPYANPIIVTSSLDIHVDLLSDLEDTNLINVSGDGFIRGHIGTIVKPSTGEVISGTGSCSLNVGSAVLATCDFLACASPGKMNIVVGNLSHTGAGTALASGTGSVNIVGGSVDTEDLSKMTAGESSFTYGNGSYNNLFTGSVLPLLIAGPRQKFGETLQTFNGIWITPSYDRNCSWQRHNYMITMFIPSIYEAKTETAASISTTTLLPAEIRPIFDTYAIVHVLDSSSPTHGIFRVTTGGSIYIYKDIEGGLFSVVAGSAGFRAFTVQWFSNPA